MSRKIPKNIGASIRQKLLNLSQQSKQDYNLILARYAAERFLYRLSQSRYASHFILKGALLFSVWMSEPHRPTRDIDLLGLGDLSDDVLTDIIKEVVLIENEWDGLEFSRESVTISDIREGHRYHGKRIMLGVRLETARMRLQIDVGFGDVLTPEIKEIEYPAFLDMPGPRIRAYPPTLVVAEKVQAMIVLGLTNSRMKDFYDLWTMAREFSFNGHELYKAMASTFKRRHTPISNTLPIPLTDRFANHEDKIKQWQGFLRRSRLSESSEPLTTVVAYLREFILPPLHAVAAEQAFSLYWNPGGPWGEADK